MKCVPHLAGKPPHSLILFCLNNASNTYINIPVLVLAFLFRRKAMHSNSLDTCGQTCVETRCYGISGGMCHGSNNLLHCLIICNVNRIIVVFYSNGNMEIWDGFFLFARLSSWRAQRQQLHSHWTIGCHIWYSAVISLNPASQVYTFTATTGCWLLNGTYKCVQQSRSICCVSLLLP